MQRENRVNIKIAKKHLHLQFRKRENSNVIKGKGEVLGERLDFGLSVREREEGAREERGKRRKPFSLCL